MKIILSYIIFICLPLNVFAGEPLKNKCGRIIAYPYVLEQAKPVHFLVKEAKNPDHYLHRIHNAKIIDSKALLFDAQIDERLHVFEQCLFWVHVRFKEVEKWWLVVFYRWPYGNLLVHQNWDISRIDDVHSPLAFRQFNQKPTKS